MAWWDSRFHHDPLWSQIVLVHGLHSWLFENSSIPASSTIHFDIRDSSYLVRRWYDVDPDLQIAPTRSDRRSSGSPTTEFSPRTDLAAQLVRPEPSFQAPTAEDEEVRDQVRQIQSMIEQDRALSSPGPGSPPKKIETNPTGSSSNGNDNNDNNNDDDLDRSYTVYQAPPRTDPTIASSNPRTVYSSVHSIPCSSPTTMLIIPMFRVNTLICGVIYHPQPNDPNTSDPVWQYIHGRTNSDRDTNSVVFAGDDDNTSHPSVPQDKSQSDNEPSDGSLSPEIERDASPAQASAMSDSPPRQSGQSSPMSRGSSDTTSRSSGAGSPELIGSRFVMEIGTWRAKSLTVHYLSHGYCVLESREMETKGRFQTETVHLQTFRRKKYPQLPKQMLLSSYIKDAHPCSICRRPRLSCVCNVVYGPSSTVSEQQYISCSWGSHVDRLCQSRERLPFLQRFATHYDHENPIARGLCIRKSVLHEQCSRLVPFGMFVDVIQSWLPARIHKVEIHLSFSLWHYEYGCVGQPIDPNRRFGCPYCFKSFRLKGNCNSHIRVIHEQPNVRPFVCRLCGAAFKQRSKLRRHSRIVHDLYLS